MIDISGKITIPEELRQSGKRGLFKKTEWRKILRVVEQQAMGAGGVLEDHLGKLAPLAPATLRRKAKQGLPSTPLIGKRRRILKAVSGSSSTFRKRKLIWPKKTSGAMLRIFFNPAAFTPPGAKTPFTYILQRGRLAGLTHGGKTVGRKAAVAAAKAKAIPKGAEIHRSPARPVMAYQRGDEAKLTPALVTAVHDALKTKGLTT